MADAYDRDPWGAALAAGQAENTLWSDMPTPDEEDAAAAGFGTPPAEDEREQLVHDAVQQVGGGTVPPSRSSQLMPPPAPGTRRRLRVLGAQLATRTALPSLPHSLPALLPRPHKNR